EGLLAGMARAERELCVSSKLMLCFLRHLDEHAAFDVLHQAEPGLDRIEGVGLDSSEDGHPPSKFQRACERTGQMGLKRGAQAGEEGPPQHVREALDHLHIDRMDHGSRSMEDEELIVRLAASQMTLTV